MSKAQENSLDFQLLKWQLAQLVAGAARSGQTWACATNVACLGHGSVEISARPCHQNYPNGSSNHAARTAGSELAWLEQCHAAVATSAWLTNELCLLWDQCWEWPCGKRWEWPCGQEWQGPGVTAAGLVWKCPRGWD